MSKTTFGTYHYSVTQVMAKRLFQQSLSDHYVGRSLFFMEKVMAYSFCGSPYHKRIYLLYSVVKELWRKRVAFV
jgi:hypothetical protein